MPVPKVIPILAVGLAVGGVVAAAALNYLGGTHISPPADSVPRYNPEPAAREADTPSEASGSGTNTAENRDPAPENPPADRRATADGITTRGRRASDEEARPGSSRTSQDEPSRAPDSAPPAPEPKKEKRAPKKSAVVDEDAEKKAAPREEDGGAIR